MKMKNYARAHRKYIYVFCSVNQRTLQNDKPFMIGEFISIWGMYKQYKMFLSLNHERNWAKSRNLVRNSIITEICDSTRKRPKMYIRADTRVTGNTGQMKDMHH